MLQCFFIFMKVRLKTKRATLNVSMLSSPVVNISGLLSGFDSASYENKETLYGRVES